ncbi:urease accessory protein UreG [Nonomuraea sp. MCN248]|uniref:Urease accessory protein UreG n=1 Tax=Nonomuraea corallina TaxID=2989783 RepID=A0ABT4SAZ4_9ACTN|nr:urease accessory protein UreG [Nonomuraea corallina]MDA0634379.1 urease accessory protein UreG [Nonomuraea corallina]
MDHHHHHHDAHPAVRPELEGVFKVGVGGPVGSGKTALIEALVPILIERGHSVGVVTNDIYTQEDADHVKRTLHGVLEPERIVGVETGSCPHTAVRDDPTMNLAAGAELIQRFTDIDTLLYESGGDNLTLTFSPALADVYVFVLDTGEGDKMPRKRGPGITNSDLLVINKIDIAPYVRADLEVMARDADRVREGRPVILTDSLKGTGVEAVADFIAGRRPVCSPTA